MKKYNVEFMAGIGRNSNNPVNYMMVEIDDVELYAEIEIPDDETNEAGEYSKYDEIHYPILKNMILEQAKENDIDTNCLQFWWD